MKNKIVILMVLILFIMPISGCSTRQEVEVNTLATAEQETEINILATTDLHGIIPNKLISYVKKERKKDENLTLVDAGDFFDSSNRKMKKYFDKRRDDFDKGIEKYIEAPIAKEMGKLDYDAIVLGNHEFVSNNKFHLDNLMFDFDKQNMPILSANTYKSNGENYTKPYIIKKISTNKGDINVGILGLTIKEVGESFNFTEDGKKVAAKSRDLKDQGGYEGELYMNDLVEDAKKWVDIMEKDNVDIIVAVVHSGEKPENPKNPGNRIQELAQQVEGIDAIVAGHTHKKISQHDYKNKSGETVIVTQPGSRGEFISKINFKLEKQNDNWIITNKTSKAVKF